MRRAGGFTFRRAPKRGADTSAAAEALGRAAPPLPRYSPPMSEVLDMAAIAALIGDPARANILCALLDGRALTASELAYAAHVTPQTASGHLGKLASAKLIVPAQQGRHRYFRLAGAHIAAMLESISAVASIGAPRLRPIRIDDQMRKARMCYDHIAGELGVTLADALQEHRHIELAKDGGSSRNRARILPQTRDRSHGRARQPPCVLPPLCRMERTAFSSRRRRRQRARAAADGAALDLTQARRPRAHHHAGRLEQDRADLRLLAARSRAASRRCASSPGDPPSPPPPPPPPTGCLEIGSGGRLANRWLRRDATRCPHFGIIRCSTARTPAEPISHHPDSRDRAAASRIVSAAARNDRDAVVFPRRAPCSTRSQVSSSVCAAQAADVVQQRNVQQRDDGARNIAEPEFLAADAAGTTGRTRRIARALIRAAGGRARSYPLRVKGDVTAIANAALRQRPAFATRVPRFPDRGRSSAILRADRRICDALPPDFDATCLPRLGTGAQ